MNNNNNSTIHPLDFLSSSSFANNNNNNNNFDHVAFTVEEDQQEQYNKELALSSSLSSSISKPMSIPNNNNMNMNKNRLSQYSMKSLPTLLSTPSLPNDNDDNASLENSVFSYYYYNSSSLPEFKVGSLPKQLPPAWPIELIKELTTPTSIRSSFDYDKPFSYSDPFNSSSSSPADIHDHPYQDELFVLEMDESSSMS
ncbi:hypothetical protein BJ944DRAFT_265983 [Cunninghamella echinulata]|nr:hypothetical protein BJ944DRAFT_265983 [Cunninghamella echinulata]